ncbi:MAG TPA: C40 family peptidase [Sulfuricurvum sp.]|nr:MAG: hypothetical protein B7Y30_05455 [Campylobacterales bacterium 16-40-21]OZA03688.1 MAG: hypothetical protein B7X89_03195 [Sulfuricurvum sp. 17-40-25]HQS65796.1 C40 family peptidase [Sulfuricurvum sp.]HQT37314.1 C40 family peptidase [Sulfuricurvum sp.]
MNFKLFLFYILVIHVNTLFAESKRQEPSVFLKYEQTLTEVQDSNTKRTYTFTNNKIIEKADNSDNTLTYLKANPLSSSSPRDDKSELNTQDKLSKKIKSLKEKIIAKAKMFLGTPYHFGSKSLEQTDCSGFIQQVYSDLGIVLPRTTVSQAQRGVNVDFDNLEVGDLLFFCTYKNGPSHVGIYTGNDKMIHASSGAKRVKYDNINKLYYKKRFLFAKRLALKKYINTGMTPVL